MRVAFRHFVQKGHFPSWVRYEYAPGLRFCQRCIGGGRRIRPLVPLGIPA
jgi:hypothetical protein